jgi:hypothetical protein
MSAAIPPPDVVPDSAPHLVAFMPWVTLKRPCEIAGIRFVSLHDSAGNVRPELAEHAEALKRILSSYVDRKGNPRENCVVATVSGRGCDLTKTDGPGVEWASRLLFLACWARNDYFPRYFGPYSNSTAFRVYWQAFTGFPKYITLGSRRRDGGATHGGYKHGEIRFDLPPQCSHEATAEVDEAFLVALDAAQKSASSLITRLERVIPYVQLANTDDDLMDEKAESILMGSAFEQLLKSEGRAYKVGKKFGETFERFGNVRVADALKSRPGIEIDQSNPDRAAAQPLWWVHRKWMEELYDVRSKAVHQGTHSTRTWGWSLYEHLLMAAFVFPLTVKILLEQEGAYALTDDDIGNCTAVDRLLAALNWDEETEGGTGPQRWHVITSQGRHDKKFERIVKKIAAGHFRSPAPTKNAGTDDA